MGMNVGHKLIEAMREALFYAQKLRKPRRTDIRPLSVCRRKATRAGYRRTSFRIIPE